jgi:hypothetical protein
MSLETWPHLTVSDSRLPHPGGPSPCIYIPQEQGGPVRPPPPTTRRATAEVVFDIYSTQVYCIAFLFLLFSLPNANRIEDTKIWQEIHPVLLPVTEMSTRNIPRG